MRDVAIKSICNKLIKQHNINLSEVVALDFYARGGDWQTQYYASQVKKIYAWEIESQFESQLKQNLPSSAEIKIGNSFELASSKESFFDMVVLDNPQGCYGNKNEYCEHFESLPLALNLLKESGGIIVFNVKATPWSYDDKKEWQFRRNSFYNLKDSSSLSEEFLFNFYKDFFHTRGYETVFSFWDKRPQEDGLYAFTVQLTKQKNEHHQKHNQ